ncbi:MAG: hypothetical protein ACXVQR_07960, partial [Solirubrobacteraceae bacterium]
RVSRGIQERNAKVAREADRLSTQLGRSPTIEELAEDGPGAARFGAEDPGFAAAEQRAELWRGLEALPPRGAQHHSAALL